MTEKLTSNLKLALQDCVKYPRGYFIWRPKSMQKLEALGLARKIPHPSEAGVMGWEVTEAGEAALREAQQRARTPHA